MSKSDSQNISSSKVVVKLERTNPNQVEKELGLRVKVALTKQHDRNSLKVLRDNVHTVLERAGLRIERGVTESLPFIKNPKFKVVQPIVDKGIEVLPGINSFSRRYLNFLLDLYNRFMTRFGDPVLDDRGMAGPNAYGVAPSKLLTVAGAFPASGGGYPIDNSKYRQDLGLSSDWVSPRDAELAKVFFSLLFGVADATPVRVPDQSNSGYPECLHNKAFKILNVSWAAENLDHVLSLCREGKLKDLNDLYDLVFCFIQGQRTQPDVVGKKRVIVPLAESNDLDYHEIVVDNSVKIDGIPSNLAKHFSSIRFRYVWGQSNLVNSLINMVGGSCREVYGRVYEFTFKHRSIEHLRSKLQTWNKGIDDGQYPLRSELGMCFLDITGYDRATLFRFIEVMIERFEGTDFYDLIKRSAWCPMNVRSRDKGHEVKDQYEEIFLNGDPLDFDPNTHAKQGLLSGWGWVSDAGKWAAFAIYLVGVECGILAPTVKDMHLFLKGEHPRLACFNLGDDNVIIGRWPDLELWEAHFKDSPYWKFDYEPGSRFIGMIFHKDGGSRYDISNDPVSATMQNVFIPEYGWWTLFRQYPATGEFMKFMQLKAPFMTEISALRNEVFENHYGYSFDQMIADAKTQEEARIAEAASRSSLDGADLVAVLSNHYGEDIALRETILRDLVRDVSVERWKYTDDDFFAAFGIKRWLLEQRPATKYSSLMLEKAGYSKVHESNRYGEESGIFRLVNAKMSGLSNRLASDLNEVLDLNVRNYYDLTKGNSNE